MLLDRKTLGAAIKAARSENKVTQERLAEMVGIAPSHVKQIESGSRSPSVEVLYKLAYTLNFSVDDADVFIAYNQTGFDKYSAELDEKDLVLVNSTLVAAVNPHHFGIPATQIAEEMGRPQAVNMVMLGALTKLLPKLHYSKVVEVIEKDIPMPAARSNMEAFEKGYQYIERELSPKKLA